MSGLESDMASESNRAVHPDARIGHVHLKVADIERALKFYRDVLGFELTQRFGHQAAFLSAGGYHTHIGLNTWESHGGFSPPPPPPGPFLFAVFFSTPPPPPRGLSSFF